MKLTEGMYVRTKCGIGKLLYFNEELEEWVNDEYNCYTEDFIVEASHSLLGNDKEPSLIERGDYVNGEEVCGLYELNGKRYADVDRVCYTEEEIKTIVTKEQFEAMQYEIK